jgi:hypothetical protein
VNQLVSTMTAELFEAGADRGAGSALRSGFEVALGSGLVDAVACLGAGDAELAGDLFAVSVNGAHWAVQASPFVAFFVICVRNDPSGISPEFTAFFVIVI